MSQEKPVASTTVVADIQNRVLEVYKPKAKYTGTLAAFAEQWQELRIAAVEVMVETTIDEAVGAQLDVKGRLVDQPRGNLNDTDYRSAIRSRIRANRANAVTNDLIAAMKAALPRSYEANDLGGATFIVRIVDELSATTDPSPETLQEILRRAKGAGIRARFQYQLTDDDETFTWASGDVAEASTTQGWSDDAGTTGGSFSDYVE